MAVDKQEFGAGVKLVARFKKVDYTCETVMTEEGLRFRLGDGTEHKSISAAAKAITHGPINGWSFFTVEGQQKERKPRAQRIEAPATEGEGEAQEPAARMVKVVVRCTRQQDVPEGQVKWYCKACADSFTVPASITPQGCPKGHAAEAPNGELVTLEPQQPVAEPPVEAATE